MLVPRDAGLTDLGLAVRGSKSHLSRAVLVPEHAEGAMEGLAGVMAREPQIQAVVLDSREALVIFQNVPVNFSFLHLEFESLICAKHCAKHV